MRSNSLFYGRPISANAYPQYSTAELEQTLESARLDDDTRAMIEAEISRRAAAKIAKREARR